MNIDWRNRFGSSFVTTIRDQYPCQSCWAFAATALVESMIRIEHSIWAVKSEGEIHKGVGKQCPDAGNMGEVSPFLSNYGLADPDCFPNSASYGIYEAYQTPNVIYKPLLISPVSDRLGRTARLNSLEVIAGEADQMRWIDDHGPLVAMLEVFSDFRIYGTGIYQHSSAAISRGFHWMLIIGFNNDDPNNKYWIAKNQYGPTWGEHGFMKIKFGEGRIGSLHGGMFGLRNINPSPWSKRRYRNGCMIESGSGGIHRNFELFIMNGGNLQWWYRDNTNPALPWGRVGNIQSERHFGIPVALQSTYNRNYELVIMNNTGQLDHLYFSQYDRNFHSSTSFGFKFEGIPGFIQTNKSAPGDFEVVIRTDNGQLSHWVRHNGAPWTHDPNSWYSKGLFANDITHSGPSLIQAHPTDADYRNSRLELGKGDLHLVCVHKSGKMQHWKNDGLGWTLYLEFGSGINSSPCMIEGLYNCPDELSIGNFELCVANKSGKIEHWSFDNSTTQWTLNHVFGMDVNRVSSLLQGSFKFNLDLIVERLDGKIQHYWYDVNSNTWNTGVIIT